MTGYPAAGQKSIHVRVDELRQAGDLANARSLVRERLSQATGPERGRILAALARVNLEAKENAAAKLALEEALTLLGPALDGWTVRLCGNKPEGSRDAFEQSLHDKLAASGVSVELAGWVPADEMPRHWAAAKIACVPSKRAPSGDAEGLPLVCIEAMLSGCALAATRHSGIVECVREGETGYLCDEGDAAALAKNLRKMLNEAAATDRMGAAGRALAMERFNLQTQSRKLEAHLMRIAGLAGA